MIERNRVKLKISTGTPLILGALKIEQGVNFAVVNSSEQNCCLMLYDLKSGQLEREIKYTDQMKFGNVYAMKIDGLNIEDFGYLFKIGNDLIMDPYAKKIHGRAGWGSIPKSLALGCLITEDFNWEGDKGLQVPFEDTIIYHLHVRGFTKDTTSKVSHKGTFLGILEKLPYLKELGVTLVELMPAYDFDEIILPDKSHIYDYSHDYGTNQENHRINYWGYTKGNYFVPKNAYAANQDDPVSELKYVIQKLHENGIEIGMEFYFEQEVSPQFVLECIRYWVLEYHLDSVHVSAGPGTMVLLQNEPLLSETKILGWGFSIDDNKAVSPRNLGSLNEGFLINARKFLKGDEDQVGGMSFQIKNNPKNLAMINYIANHGTFTLMDLVSYDRKHNEENGENNNDGAEYNYSWNCGIEGPTKKRKISELRLKQIKNALSFVLLSQGVPMIYAGDEYGNSQKGNNNPYCQDNPIGWVNWRNTIFNKEILDFTKELIAFRKANSVLHMREEMRVMDYRALGLPDISYHGNKPWYSDFDHVNRHFAVMYCGKYGTTEGGDIYIAYNMHWESQSFGLPGALEEKHWEIALSTNGHIVLEDNKNLTVPPRSVAILKAWRKVKK